MTFHEINQSYSDYFSPYQDPFYFNWTRFQLLPNLPFPLKRKLFDASLYTFEKGIEVGKEISEYYLNSGVSLKKLPDLVKVWMFHFSYHITSLTLDDGFFKSCTSKHDVHENLRFLASIFFNIQHLKVIKKNPTEYHELECLNVEDFFNGFSLQRRKTLTVDFEDRSFFTALVGLSLPQNAVTALENKNNKELIKVIQEVASKTVSHLLTNTSGNIAEFFKLKDFLVLKSYVHHVTALDLKKWRLTNQLLKQLLDVFPKVTKLQPKRCKWVDQVSIEDRFKSLISKKNLDELALSVQPKQTVDLLSNSFSSLTIQPKKTKRIPPAPKVQVQELPFGIFSQALDFLIPKSSNIAAWGDIYSFLATKKTYEVYRKMVVNHLLQNDPAAFVTMKAEPLHVIKKLNPKELVFSSSISKLLHPGFVTHVDIRSYVVDSQDPYSWAFHIAKYYPNTEKLFLPLNSVIDEKVGLILASLQKLSVLDITYSNKQNIRGLLHLKHIKELYSQNAFDLKKIVWLDTCQEILEKERLEKVHPKSEKLDECGLNLLFNLDSLPVLSRLKNLEVLHLGSLLNLDTEKAKFLTQFKKLREFQVRSVMLKDECIALLPQSITSLSIYGCTSFTDASIDLIAKHLPDLSELYIGDMHLSDRGVAQLKHCLQLQSLIFRNMIQMSQKGWESLSECKQLKKLTLLESCVIGDQELMSLGSIPKLEFLKIKNGKTLTLQALSYFNTKKPAAKLVYSTTPFEYLKNHVDVEDKMVDILDVRTLSESRLYTIPKLFDRFLTTHTLKLPALDVNQALVDTLVKLQNLRVLDISMCSQKNTAELSKLTSLTELSNRYPYELHDFFWQTPEERKMCVESLQKKLPANFLVLRQESFTDKDIWNLSKLKDLKVLDLGFCPQVTDESLSIIGKELLNIQELHLNTATITVAGIKQLAPLKNLKTLSVFDCYGLCDAAFDLIVKQFPNLTSLYFGNNTKITKKTFEMLAQMKMLKYLVITGLQKMEKDAWKMIAKIQSLEKLYLVKTKEINQEVILSLASCPKLSLLHLADCQVVSEAHVKGVLSPYIVSEKTIGEFRKKRPHTQLIFTPCEREAFGFILKEIAETKGESKNFYPTNFRQKS